jgi:catechol-2,3-dioxygenase
MFAKGKERGVETRGVVDHGMVHSIYFRDPNGYVIELTAKMPGHDAAMNPQTNGARSILDKWQSSKSSNATPHA